MAVPLFETVPVEGRPHRLEAFEILAEGLGFDLAGWQAGLLRVASEISESGLPVYREIVGSVPRQSGKSILAWLMMLDRALNWGEDQRIVYTSYSGHAGRLKLIYDFLPLLERSSLFPRVVKVTRANGFEAIEFDTGSRIEALPSTSTAGHGRTLDLGVIDEAWADGDDRREQAMGPAMATRETAQLLVLSTAGDGSSVYWNRKLEAARLSVGAPSRLCVVHYAAPNGAAVDDETVYAEVMPALRTEETPGGTISIDTVRHARQMMPEGEFRRAYFNQESASSDRPIPDAAWADVQNAEVEKPDPAVFAIESDTERRVSALLAADKSGRVEVIEVAAGTSWLADRLAALGGEVAVDANGPLGFLIADLKARFVEVAEYSQREVGYAWGYFVTRLADGTLQVRPHPALDEAIGGAVRRPVGDQFVWERTDDSAPLIAMCLALHRAASKPELRPLF